MMSGAAVAICPVTYTGPTFAGMEWTPEAVKQLRDDLALSQSEFARLVGVRRATVSDWERGAAVPRRIALSVFDQLAARRKKKSARGG